jgi:hypothetical protein
MILNDTTTATQVTTQTMVSTSATTVTSVSTATVTQDSIGASQISITSLTLYGGVAATNSSQPTSSLHISFNDKNSPTYITSLILETPSGVPITAWDNGSTTSNSGNQIVFSSSHAGNIALSGSSISFFYPAAATAVPILSVASFQYSIFFASGNLIQGNIIAQ